jgi:hypothetical protein
MTSPDHVAMAEPGFNGTLDALSEHIDTARRRIYTGPTNVVGRC